MARIVGGNCQLHLETEESGGFQGRVPDANEIFQNAQLQSLVVVKTQGSWFLVRFL